nr:DUF3097 family protein [Actinomycetota bacterium]
KITLWPEVPPSIDWKSAVCQQLGVADPDGNVAPDPCLGQLLRDLEPALLGAVERLIDFVTEPCQPSG